MLAAALACGPVEEPSPTVPTRDAGFVGTAECTRCHAEEAALWEGSHHDLAMQEANESTALGDFDDAELTHFGVTTTFRKRDGRLFVHTEGRDGSLREFEVAYTFGVEPLQQYLIGFPDGRFQALDIAWDARPKEAGGQRWLPLHPGERISHDDVLHWTGPGLNWNAMCAACHSTGLEKNYDLEANRYASTWSEIDVSCEACHGPGAEHVRQAEAGTGGRGLVPLSGRGEWVLDEGAPIARRSASSPHPTELTTCAPCHSRRTQIGAAAPGAPFLESHLPALLEERLYHADGQIREEVYIWGSFLQSRMYAAGVTCSDCHDPHALRIESPDEACGRCHRAEVFAKPEHHHHAPESLGASCVACHMPSRTYMVIDDRRDHSFRVPRPDLSVELGVPNACSGCHDDRPVGWAAREAEAWWGTPSSPYGSQALFGDHEALAELAADEAQPDIVRATALQGLRRRPGPESVASIERGAASASSLIRLAAARAAESLPSQHRGSVASSLLRDPVRSIRIEAARVLAPLLQQLEGSERAALERALDDYRAAQAWNGDRAEARSNLALLHAQLGELDQARAEYENALRINPFFVPAYVNLADLARQEGRDDEGEVLLRRALEVAPDQGMVHHALGLLLVRRERLDDAIQALERAAALTPQEPRYAYVHAVALRSAGRIDAALAVLEEARRRHPDDRAIATFHEQLRRRR